MTEPERVALEHIRRVADSILGEETTPAAPVPAASGGTAPASLLSVPYISQLGAGADKFVNDSGAAAGAMLVRAYTDKTPSPDEFFSRFGQVADKFLTPAQITAGLTAYGVAVEQRTSLKISDLAVILASGRPAILLVKYGVLAAAGLTPETDAGPHCLVAIGLDVDHVFVHDPLRKDVSGQGQGLPWLTFYQAWTQAAGYQRAALIPRLALVRRMRITAANLNIRLQPNTISSIVGTAKAGDVFEVTAQNDGWGQIGEGQWINLSYAADI
jgi:hypothetical protein